MFTLSIPRRRKAGVMNRTHRRPGPSRYRLSFHAAGMLVVCFALSVKGTSADLHVDPNQGQDSADGITSPVKTLAAAIRQSNPGDTIHLMPNLVYRDWAAFLVLREMKCAGQKCISHELTSLTERSQNNAPLRCWGRTFCVVRFARIPNVLVC